MHRFDLDSSGAGLPVAAARDELEQGAAQGAMVVTAPPGTGKTTFVPPLLANLLANRADGHGTVLLTQPRRVAARAAARRIAALDGSALGEAVGFTVRGERRVSPGTRIEALTPGVLLRRLIADPALDGVGAVVLDEVHQRSVDGDLLLGMLSEARELRDDLTVVAMSATLDAGLFSKVLGDAPIVRVPSALHPLRIEHAPYEGARIDERGVTRGYLAHLARVAAAAQAAEGCDALVFVPGAREVDELVLRLREPGTGGRLPVEVLPLHGRLSAKAQDRAVRGRAPGEPPRIVVSTALAESSLTVPGVRLVVDAGLSRELRRDRGRDMVGLVTVSASRASAEQRSGRAARQGPGVAIRAYSESEFARMPAASPPEIASADLLDTALLLAAWGTPEGRGLRLPSPPPQSAMREAVRLLRALGLIDVDGRVTQLGAEISRLPVGVREARALLDGAEALGEAGLAAEVVAAVSDDHRESGAELPRLLRELRSGRAPGAERWKRETRRLGAIARAHLAEVEGRAAHDAPLEAAPGIVCALARPEWLARRVGEHSRSYLLASGSRAALPEGSSLQASEWIAVREVQRADGRAADGTGAVIRLAAPIAEEDALRIAAPLRADEREAEIVDGRVRVREQRRLGAILLASTPVAAELGDTGAAFAAHLRTHGLEELEWSEPARSLRGRLALLRRALGDPWPAVDDAALLQRLSDWLGPELERLEAGAALSRLDVASALRRLLPWPEAARLDELAPERLEVPSGSRITIDYPQPGDERARPIVAVKLQEVFGLAETPRLAGGLEPILFHLLSPARRPLAVTDDLLSFWNGPYRQVRAEMRGRYPKHPWPEDPWSAEATARAKPRQHRA